MRGMTTTEVKDKFIVNETKYSKLSYCELLKSRCPNDTNVGTADWFYSHAWSYLFLDTVHSCYIACYIALLYGKGRILEIYNQDGT